MADFAYINSINRITGFSPFEAVTVVRPRIPIDLVPLPTSTQPSVGTEDFIRHMRQVHKDVRRNIAISNES